MRRLFAEKSKAAAIQHPMNVFGYEKEVLSVCEQNRLTSINNSPLAMGLLSGKFDENTVFSADDVRGAGHDWVPFFQDGKPRRAFLQKLESIREILQSGGRTLVQGALSWLWAKSDRNIPIPGFKTPEQVIENTEAMSFGPLSPPQMEEIDRLLDNK